MVGGSRAYTKTNENGRYCGDCARRKSVRWFGGLEGREDCEMDGVRRRSAFGEHFWRNEMGDFANLGQIAMEDLQIVEHICRKDPKVIEQCVISGIPKEDMHKVYCDRMSTADFQKLIFANPYSLDNWI